MVYAFESGLSSGRGFRLGAGAGGFRGGFLRVQIVYIVLRGFFHGGGAGGNICRVAVKAGFQLGELFVAHRGVIVVVGRLEDVMEAGIVLYVVIAQFLFRDSPFAALAVHMLEDLHHFRLIVGVGFPEGVLVDVIGFKHFLVGLPLIRGFLLRGIPFLVGEGKAVFLHHILDQHERLDILQGSFPYPFFSRHAVDFLGKHRGEIVRHHAGSVIVCGDQIVIIDPFRYGDVVVLRHPGTGCAAACSRSQSQRARREASQRGRGNFFPCFHQ